MRPERRPTIPSWHCLGCNFDSPYFDEGLQGLLNTLGLHTGIIFHQQRQAATIRTGGKVDPEALENPAILSRNLFRGKESPAALYRGVEHVLSAGWVEGFAQTVGFDIAVGRVNTIGHYANYWKARREKIYRYFSHF